MSRPARPAPTRTTVATGAKVRTSGDTFDPAARKQATYFANTPCTDLSAHIADIRLPAICVSAHEMSARRPMPALEAWWARADVAGPRLLCVDSGVRNLVARVAAETGRDGWEVAATPPADVPGFARLKEHYLRVLDRYRGRLWGHFELDLGAVEDRRATRAEMEAAGHVAIPIFQMGEDPWDYFDELVRAYDRVGVAFFVARYGREARLLATLWERWQRADPTTWVHLLGYTPTHYLHAYPFPSTDSSDWTAAVKWDGLHPRLDARRFGAMPQAYRHARGAANDGPRGTRRVARLAALNALWDAEIWARHAASFAALDRDDADDDETGED